MEAWIRVMASEVVRCGLISLIEGELGLEMGEGWWSFYTDTHHEME